MAQGWKGAFLYRWRWKADGHGGKDGTGLRGGRHEGAVRRQDFQGRRSHEPVSLRRDCRWEPISDHFQCRSNGGPAFHSHYRGPQLDCGAEAIKIWTPDATFRITNSWLRRLSSTI